MEVAEVEVVAKTAKAEKDIESLSGAILKLSETVEQGDKQTEEGLRS